LASDRSGTCVGPGALTTKSKTWRKVMSTIPTKILTTFAAAAAIAVGSLAVSSTADARTYRHHHYYSYYRPYVYPRAYAYSRPYFYPRAYARESYPDDYGRYYGGPYAYRPEYRRAPIYNQDDATKFSRQLVGHGDSNSGSGAGNGLVSGGG
jgi:hypothetical protein